MTQEEFHVILRAIESEALAHQAKVLDGSLSDFAAYRYQTGVIAGLNRAMSVINDLAERAREVNQSLTGQVVHLPRK